MSLFTPLVHARALGRQIDHGPALGPRRFEMIRQDQNEVRATGAFQGPQRPARRGAGPPQRVTAQPG